MRGVSRWLVTLCGGQAVVELMCSTMKVACNFWVPRMFENVTRRCCEIAELEECVMAFSSVLPEGEQSDADVVGMSSGDGRLLGQRAFPPGCHWREPRVWRVISFGP